MFASEFDDDPKSSSDDMSEYGSDLDPDDHLSPSSGGEKYSHDDGTGKDLAVEDFMELMDRELAQTTIGKSFVKDDDVKKSEVSFDHFYKAELPWVWNALRDYLTTADIFLSCVHLKIQKKKKNTPQNTRYFWGLWKLIFGVYEIYF